MPTDVRPEPPPAAGRLARAALHRGLSACNSSASTEEAADRSEPAQSAFPVTVSTSAARQSFRPSRNGWSYGDQPSAAWP